MEVLVTKKKTAAIVFASLLASHGVSCSEKEENPQPGQTEKKLTADDLEIAGHAVAAYLGSPDGNSIWREIDGDLFTSYKDPHPGSDPSLSTLFQFQFEDAELMLVETATTEADRAKGVDWRGKFRLQYKRWKWVGGQAQDARWSYALFEDADWLDARHALAPQFEFSMIRRSEAFAGGNFVFRFPWEGTAHDFVVSGRGRIVRHDEKPKTISDFAKPPPLAPTH